jgi:hypothetical protein
VYPSLVETLVTMKKLCKKGDHEFALHQRPVDRSTESDYLYAHLYSKPLEVSASNLYMSLSSLSFQDAIYYRHQN